ncbi:MAG: hypothetical protein ACTSO4_16370 [Promethearchaeota archaeon]
MKFQEVKKEIHRIAKIEDPSKAQDEIKLLDYHLHKRPKIKTPIKRGRYYYFYIIEKYDKKGYEKLGPKIGRMLTDNFEKNKSTIEKLRKEGKIEELKKYLEQY